MKIHVAATIVIGLGLASCSNFRTSPLRGGPHYFGWADLYRAPSYPSHPISPAEAAAHETSGTGYYVAYYDEAGRLASLEHRSLHHWTRYEYSYAGHGLKKIVTTTDAGEAQERVFD